MDSINWNTIAQKAANQTDEEFNKELASLTKLNVNEVDSFIAESKITNANAIKTLNLINDATTSNNEKAKAILNIENGLGFVLSMVKKVL